MEVVKHEPMIVVCEYCKTTLESNDLNDFRDCGHTYPPTIMFVCPSCGSESRVTHPHPLPDRLRQSLVMKISRERGYGSTIHFDRGSSVI